MWRKGNPCTLFVGTQIGAATVENIREVPQKTKTRTTKWSSNSTPGYMSKKKKNENINLKSYRHPRVHSSIIYLFTLKMLLKCSWFTMLYQFLLYSKVTQWYIFFHVLSIMVHHRLTEYSSLRSCCSSILCITVCICWSQTPNPSLPTPFPLGNHKSVLYIWESGFLFLIDMLICVLC